MYPWQKRLEAVLKVRKVNESTLGKTMTTDYIIRPEQFSKGVFPNTFNIDAAEVRIPPGAPWPSFIHVAYTVSKGQRPLAGTYMRVIQKYNLAVYRQGTTDITVFND